jgi:hypothetical protein
MWNRRVGLQSALRQRLEERIRAIESRDLTKPHTSEYERFHFDAKAAARHLEAAEASLPRRPSAEKTRGVKVRRRARQSAPYLSFFFFMAQENLSWVGVAVRRLISIGDSYIKDCCLAFGPKAINSKISTEF